MADDRVSIIQSIKTPLGLLSLVVLVTEAILGVFATKSEGTERMVLMIGMLVVLIFILVIVFMKADSLGGGSGGKTPAIAKYHEMFLAAPMASFGSDNDYKKGREMVIEVVKCFKDNLGMKKIFYAGQDIQSIESFEAPTVSVEEDFKSLSASEYFVMILPNKLPSSVLVEAGAALSLGIPSIYFVRNREDLPFLLKEASQAFNYVRIYEYQEVRDILNLVKSSKMKLFSTRS